MNTIQTIKYILADTADLHSEIAESFLSVRGPVKITYTGDSELGEILDTLKRKAGSREVLILKEFKGRFFQTCPGSPDMICCNYRVINTCFSCLYDCAYCFLHMYLNSFGIVQFTNMDVMLNEISAFTENPPGQLIYRLGTGEFTDSLMFDEISGIARKLIALTSSKDNIMLEFKTKSDNIDHLLEIGNKGNTVISWSLSTPRNIGLYEEGTSSIDARIDAAVKASDNGYFTAFHFDPVIIYDGWKDDYSAVIDRLFSSVDHTRIPWISMGGFRYAGGFKDILKTMRRGEDMTLEEMFPGRDGKFRYLKRKRMDMYRFLIDRIASFTSTPFIYLCMESEDVWRSVMGREYTSSLDLEIDFSHAMSVFLTKTDV